MLIGLTRREQLWQRDVPRILLSPGREVACAGCLDLALWDIRKSSDFCVELLGGLARDYVNVTPQDFPIRAVLKDTARACIEAGLSLRTAVADPDGEQVLFNG
jgi:hypothetical protein